MDNGASSYRRFLDGDESAFDLIMEEYFDALIFFIDRYVSDIHASEDIAIDTFSDLLVHRSRYNFKVSLKTYLFMIGRCRALNYLKRRRKIPMDDIADYEDTADDTSVEDTVLDGERKREINSAIQSLPDDMRVAVHLVYFENLSYEEAAKVMQKNAKQIDNLLYRAKNTLRTVLGEKGEALI